MARNASDKAALQAKIEAKKAMKEKETGDQVKQESQLKAKPKKAAKTDTLDDLLSAGLSSAKKKGKK